MLLYSTAHHLFVSLGIMPHDETSHGRNVLGCVLTDAACSREYGIKLLILFCFTIPNLLSSQLVGRIVTALAVFVMMPYVALTIVGIPKVKVANWLKPPPKPRLGTMLSVLYWSLSGKQAARHGSSIHHSLLTTHHCLPPYYFHSQVSTPRPHSPGRSTDRLAPSRAH